MRNTDSKGVGGICGSASGGGTIRGCYNTGTISTTYTCPAGGILGTNEGMDVHNCYNAGRIDTNGAQYGRGIGGHDTGSYTVAGCWYLTGCDDDPASNGCKGHQPQDLRQRHRGGSEDPAVRYRDRGAERQRRGLRPGHRREKQRLPGFVV